MKTRLAALAVVAGLTAVAWLPEADPEALRAQGVAQLLREDAEHARAGEPSLLGALAQPGRPVALALTTRVDGAAASPAVERAAAAAVRSFADAPPVGLVPPTLDPGARDRLVLEIRLQGPSLVVSGSLLGDGGSEPLPDVGRWRIPDRSALLPPLVAIGVALIWKRTLLALFLGILAGAVALAFQSGAGAWAPLRGLADVFGVYLVRELTDTFRIEILGFIVALLGMVGVMTRAGGIAGLVGRALAVARSVRAAQLVTFGSGLAIFFDDYANCMLVGNTLRPLTDRLRISREKLAYLVDSTAAPVAGVSLLSTWVAFQVSVFAPHLPAVGIETDGYALFVESVPYRFYCWLTLGFVCAVAASGRDFGPMLRAERRARTTGALVAEDARVPLSESFAHLQPAPHMPPVASNALVPLAVTAGVTLAVGGGAQALFAGAVLGLVCAIALATLRRGPRLSPGEVARATAAAAPTLGFAVVLLFEAWMIGAVCADIGTADVLVAMLSDRFPPGLLPLLLFVAAAVVAFATGSSWSTMSILLPSAVPLAAALGAQVDLGSALMVVLAISAVLDGAIFGDHCSPISDTTLLSSLSTGCDPLHHVRTQLPYALLVALAAVAMGYLPLLLGWGGGPGVGLALGGLGLAGVLGWLGRPAGPAALPAA